MVHCVLSTRRLVKGQVFDARAGSAGHAASNVSLKPLSLPARGDDQKLAGLDAIPRTGGHCTNAPLHACHPSGQPDSRDPAVKFEAFEPAQRMLLQPQSSCHQTVRPKASSLRTHPPMALSNAPRRLVNCPSSNRSSARTLASGLSARCGHATRPALPLPGCPLPRAAAGMQTRAAYPRAALFA